jgi:glycosyltransferase involved in cell wall biosynthesis
VKRRLLVVSRTSPRLDPRARFLVTTLASRYEVRVVTSRAEGLRADSPLGSGVVAREVRLVFPGRGPWIITGPLRLAQLNLAAAWDMLRSRPDAVLFSDATYALVAFLARLVRGTRTIYNAQEIVWAGMPAPIAALFKRIDRAIVRTCDVWIVPSRERGEFVLREHGLQRESLVIPTLPLEPPLADHLRLRALARDKLGIGPAELVVMFQGNLFPQRGLEALLEAVREERIHVVIQGVGPLRGVLGRTAQALPFVHMLPACPNEAALRWLAMADLAWVYYGEKNPNTELACSGKFYNAVYAGVPVVCNPLPAFRAFAEQNGGVFFVDSLATQSLRARLTELLADRSARRSAGEAMALAAARLAGTPRAERLIAAVESLWTDRE